jgi:hypothetical protein
MSRHGGTEEYCDLTLDEAQSAIQKGGNPNLLYTHWLHHSWISLCTPACGRPIAADSIIIRYPAQQVLKFGPWYTPWPPPPRITIYLNPRDLRNYWYVMPWEQAVYIMHGDHSHWDSVLICFPCHVKKAILHLTGEQNRPWPHIISFSYHGWRHITTSNSSSRHTQD